MTGVRMTSCPEEMGWDYWWFWKKKQLVEIRSSARPVEIWNWTRRVQLCAMGCTRVCGVRWNGQHSKNCVSLSPRVERLNSRSQTFRTWTKESVLGFLYLWTFYISLYFTYQYICIVVLCLYNICLPRDKTWHNVKWPGSRIVVRVREHLVCMRP